ncbi:outer dense fiber protein 3-like isoform X7 [Leptidea sinapis]|uniref:outer dense fiber protein 3-like isoform X7 n=1 Tax=Leptidea sinapis TaxID=189913 RepID=UPI0021C4928A|nr:outer dense fiber protein 3-like isoform X7 [Leptidea sinapis]
MKAVKSNITSSKSIYRPGTSIIRTRTDSILSKRSFVCDSLMGIRQNPWTPTKRRGPIAAEAASPGPAVVSLPSLIGKPPPESRKSRAPAYTFGHKLEGLDRNKAGPGPATYNTEGMTAKGRATAPAVSLHTRWPPLKVAPTPAPCDYEPSKAAKAVLDHGPAFSIGLRVRVPQASINSPAPNVYSMPPVLGEAREGSKRAPPAFSITGRGKTSEPKYPMPGPGTYTTDKASAVIVRKPPAYTMAPRREIKPPTATVPGPGVYCPEKVCVNLPWAPAHTFGIRHSPFAGQSVHYPAPEEITAN